ncbi:Upstream activation factor subunit spp27 [Ceratocystis fimbriata CBS 114723]|uniref:Upstream activation factor subunit spp27 n=2 Tax=Ceratocystis TaxID=5157 RepID=A0A0F8B4H3_CERFI|nr:Upstream activation factor subunit spp27 [Ceratocystis platani]PHH50222.1 Upstream activation factor subunit spp27 [Ceratocystis fimbriata CBS 114723]
MSDPLTADEISKYTAIVDNILHISDLETVTRKKIRSGLEQALGGKDLSSQKNAIRDLIETRFDALTQSQPTTPTDSNDTDGQTYSNADEDDVKPPKPHNHSLSVEDADAKLAAELQAQENRLSRARSTRGSTNGVKSGKVTKKKSTPRKKTPKRVPGEEESDPDAPPKKGTGFQKPFNLSHQLAMLVGQPQLSRPQVVKKIWEHIKSNELQDPNDKRQIRCDDLMQAVFKQPNINMFQMNKHLGSHLYPIEEE